MFSDINIGTKMPEKVMFSIETEWISFLPLLESFCHFVHGSKVHLQNYWIKNWICRFENFPPYLFIWIFSSSSELVSTRLWGSQQLRNSTCFKSLFVWLASLKLILDLMKCFILLFNFLTFQFYPQTGLSSN